MAEEQQQMSEEQVQALQEKIKQMSPEELKEFQKKQCIFCQIISGKVQSKKVFEDDVSVGILDINPANPGHILLMPKEHYSIMPQIPEKEIVHLFMLTKSLSNTMLRALEVQGTNIVVANGVVAGQRAQHFMIHIIPRMDNDGLNLNLNEKEIQKEELKKIKIPILKKVNEIFNIKQGDKEKSNEEDKKIKEEKIDLEAVAKKVLSSSKPKSIEETQPQKKGDIDLDKISKLFK